MSGATDDGLDALANPILNSPYDLPSRHFELSPAGPTGTVVDGRRPSESFIAVAPIRKGRGKRAGDGSVQEALTLTSEQVVRNDLIDDLRREVALWRNRRYDGVTPTTRKLLEHWADPLRDNRVLFAQREAAETAIFLAEVSGRRQGYRDWRPLLEEQNSEHNAGLPRVALKMATGSGKTVVMAMLIAWHTLNKVNSPRDPRFVKRFLIVAPGITIRDRLRVLQPNDPSNYYDLRDLIPADLKGRLGKAQILIANYHAFLLRDAREIKGVSATTRKILKGHRQEDPFKETDDAMVSRVLRGWGVGSGAKQSEILVLNDEAHHCYMDKPITVEADVEEADAEARDRNADARVWFKGLQAIARKVGVKQVYDLSATPFYLSGSGYKQGFIFPWVVSDFSLMDAIESGIVKIPRIPVDDDASHAAVTYLNLWESIGKKLPGPRTKVDITDWVPPDELIGALHSLYRSYEKSYDHWQRELKPLNHTPPVFIVVCPNTKVSKLVHDWIAGTEIIREDGSTQAIAGHLPLFMNADEDARSHPRPRTILVDSAQLESGDAMKKDFKQAAAAEIDAFKRELRVSNPGADLDDISDEDLLREVMNTVGKQGRLGEGVRCVVSVAMLTEGWDANTVSHILGIRAFGSQLLCEQVVGRGLRRRSYDVNEQGLFEPEYASVYGVPFAFIPTDRPAIDPKPPKPVTLVRTVEGREGQRITFPKLAGYRLEIPDNILYLADDLPEFVIGPNTVPSWTEVAPIVGEIERIQDAPGSARPQTVAYHLAGRLLRTHYAADPGADGDHRPWLFPQLVQICRQWIDKAVRVEPGWGLGHLTTYVAWQARAADDVVKAINQQVGNERARLRPILRSFDPVGTTEGVAFHTRKECVITDPDRCQISHVVLDGTGGNTWEQLLMTYAETSPQVAAYVKNDHLAFSIPYLFEGRPHDYVPDFLLRLRALENEDFDRTLIVEVSGGQKRVHSPGSTEFKAMVARDQWCVAVNNHGGFGRWGFLEVTHMPSIKQTLDAAIQALYADDAIIGSDRDMLDFQEATHHAAP